MGIDYRCPLRPGSDSRATATSARMSATAAKCQRIGGFVYPKEPSLPRKRVKNHGAEKPHQDSGKRQPQAMAQHGHTSVLPAPSAIPDPTSWVALGHGVQNHAIEADDAAAAPRGE